MAVNTITLATIHLLDDGALQELFNSAIAAALADCEDRPQDETARQVVLTFEMTPTDPAGKNNKVSIDGTIQTKIPKYRTVPTEVRVRKTNKGCVGIFNDLSRDDADQRTLDDTK